MISSSSSSSHSQSQVTQDEFFAFHNIDRQLFFRLVFNIGRESSESMQAMAFWLWLEQNHRSTCVNTILSYPDPIIDAIFEETLLALRVVRSGEYHSSNDTHDIHILQYIVDKYRISLRYFHENRTAILHGIDIINKQVCVRAFHDIIQLTARYKTLSPQYCTQFPNYPHKNKHTSINIGDFSVSLDKTFFQGALHPIGASTTNTIYIYNNYVPQGAQENLVEFFAQMRLSENLQSQENNIPPSERTIFLTFSKGYPITEPELRDFLFRSFGDIIEMLYMQDVGENEQPLYARLVVRDARSMDIVLSGQGKVKFAINGKHVWARKYVRKNPNSPPSSPIIGPSK